LLGRLERSLVESMAPGAIDAGAHHPAAGVDFEDQPHLDALVVSLGERAERIRRSAISLDSWRDHALLSSSSARQREPGQPQHNGEQPDEDSLMVSHSTGSTSPEAARGTTGFSGATA
jgi:hypothetical protein